MKLLCKQTNTTQGPYPVSGPKKGTWISRQVSNSASQDVSPVVNITCSITRPRTCPTKSFPPLLHCQIVNETYIDLPLQSPHSQQTKGDTSAKNAVSAKHLETSWLDPQKIKNASSQDMKMAWPWPSDHQNRTPQSNPSCFVLSFCLDAYNFDTMGSRFQNSWVLCSMVVFGWLYHVRTYARESWSSCSESPKHLQCPAICFNYVSPNKLCAWPST